MNSKTALMVAGIVFAFVALMHLLRIFYGFEVIIAAYIIPMWASVAAFIVASALSIWMFAARK